MKLPAAELRALARRDPELGRAMRQVEPFPGFPDQAQRSRTYFHALVRSIIYQMLTGKSAATIYGRFSALTPGRRFPTPGEVVSLSEARLRSSGISRLKAEAIRSLAERMESGELNLSRVARRPDAEVVAALTATRGIGVWTAQMFLMFRLGRLDVMPTNDVGIQEGLRRLDGLSARPTPREVGERSAPWKPLSSVASWVLWRLVDEGNEG